MGHIKITNNSGKKIAVVHQSILKNKSTGYSHQGYLEHGETVDVNVDVNEEATNHIDFYYEGSLFYDRKSYETEGQFEGEKGTEKYNSKKLKEYYARRD